MPLDPIWTAPTMAAAAAALVVSSSSRGLLGRRLGRSSRPLLTSPRDLPPGLRGSSIRSPDWTVGVLAWVAAFPWLGLAGAVVAAGAAVIVVRARRRAQDNRVTEGRRADVVEACLTLAAELRAGQPPPVALASAAQAAPQALTVPARRAALGGDVASALREQAEQPGARALQAVAIGWEVSQHTGAGLADVLTRVVTALRADLAVRAETAAQLAAVKATARLLAVLPVFTLLIASGTGGSPVRFLTGTSYGVGCLFTGALLTWLGVVWVDRLARSAES